MIEAIDLFNKNIGGVYILDDSEEKLGDNYALYIAKKKERRRMISRGARYHRM